MPSISSGNFVSNAAQIAAGVINTTGILDGTIANIDIDSAAAIAGSKIQALSVGANAGVIPSTGITDAHIAANAAIAITKISGGAGIVNADVNASAAIVDSKLAQITTAGKVSGAALTSLSSIPSGAGAIPAANAPAPTTASGRQARDSSLTTNLVVAHGMGKTPVAIFFYTEGVGGTRHGGGAYSPSGQNSWGIVGGSAETSDTSALYLMEGSGVSNVAVVSVDGTNITFTWTKTGSPTVVFHFTWFAIA